jgi:hypothetical protein
MSFVVRGYAGGTSLISKTTASGITASHAGGTTTITIALTEANLTLAPGLYEYELLRTDSGSAYPIVDRSGFYVTATSAAAYPRLTNLATYLASLGLSQTTFSSNDTEATQFLWSLAAAESALKRMCNRAFVFASRTAFLAGNWQDHFVLPEMPVESITSLYWDPAAYAGQGTDDFASTTLLTAGTDYFLDRDRTGDNYSNSGKVFRIGGVWTGRYRRGLDQLYIHREPAPGVIKVTFTSGYGNAIRPPEDLLNGIFESATVIRKASIEGQSWQSQSGEGHSVSLGNAEDEVRRLASVRWVVQHYRRHVI